MLFKARRRVLYGDWIWEWLANKKDYIKESTYANYSNIIYNHIAPDLGKYRCKQLNNKLIQKYLLEKSKKGKLDNSGGLSDKTIRDMIAIIKSSLKAAVKEGIIKEFNFDLVYPKTCQKDKMYILSIQDQEKLTNYIMETINSKKLGILLSLYSGIRIGELCALQWKDFDFKNNIMHIDKTLQRVYIKNKKINCSKIIITSPKTHNAKRDIPINKDFAKILKHFKTNPEHYVLTCNNKWIEPRTYRSYFDKVLQNADIQKINFHGLRHTFASNCIKLGVDYKTVSELLGHSTVNITLNLYVHPQISQKIKCINMVCKTFQEKVPEKEEDIPITISENKMIQ